MPPEYIDIGAISPKFDVFSLGVVIIKIIAGNAGYFHSYEMEPTEVIDELVSFTIMSRYLFSHYVLRICITFSVSPIIQTLCANLQITKNLKQKLGRSRNSSLEIDILQVKTCVKIALRCVVADRNRRPYIKDIINELEELEAEIKKMSISSYQLKDLIGQVRV